MEVACTQGWADTQTMAKGAEGAELGPPFLKKWLMCAPVSRLLGPPIPRA